MSVTFINMNAVDSTAVELAKIDAEIESLNWLIKQCDPKEDKKYIKECKKQISDLKKRKKEVTG